MAARPLSGAPILDVVKNAGKKEPFPILADLARRAGVPQYRLAMAIVLAALPVLSVIIALAVAPLAGS